VDFLTLTNLRLADAGAYSVVVTNVGVLAGGMTSQTALLEVIEVADTDGDGLPDSFEGDHGLNPHDPTDVAGDLDGDGARNGDEYLAGTDPGNRASVLDVEQMAATGAVTIRFGGVANRSYHVLFRERSTFGPWEMLVRIPATGSSTGERVVELTDPASSTPNQRYYRLSTPGLSAPE
jgi:hypothetical protein